MQRSHRGGIIASLVVLVIAGLLVFAYQTRDKNGNNAPITAVGSTALQPLVEAAGEDYQKSHPGTSVTVQGGGSGTGLSQIAQGAVSLGNSDLYAQEKKGINSKNLVDHRVAVVGIMPIVNQEVGVDNLTLEQLTAIFTGKITNWKDVGGNDQKIVLVNRAAGSGTRAAFEKWAMNGATSKEAQEQDSSGMVKSIVKNTPGAISYVAFAYKSSDVTSVKVNGIMPTDENVENGSYPIWSYEHIYTKGQPTADTKSFLEYMQSTAFQKKYVEKLGYIAMNKMQIDRDINGHVTHK
ncbi:ABC-type phosphate transport system [Fructobacillus fructosus]|uniref:Phosphate-binding protein n=1 Tax=Fructobacillus fructosus TaxID=1631 RepID=A0ABM9MLC2_9LACO|nr:phosphate ABC transporter substrate-binding protein PstS family protein [Fructobacillus fructosus]MCK8638256.1 phosphate ABC transporter substrate-binding protein PstS family protein [Fructobacillus fructosus]CAK1222851.1 ABC-type phosphate transport system [Fructobacillus fructosus]CAK1223835.1 ABC-type phosphate transport system [Fructobacillus fructosus]CAK1227742.1 ABC-type phosphate transport system [Fructobacillus fructosus]CAK1229324.1 ABC-type phosphate transport system [Fructobacil